MTTAALIVAAGRGSRAGDGLPKQYRSLGDRTILARTMEAFLSHPGIDTVLVVIHPDDAGLYGEALAEIPSSAKVTPVAFGGETRQDSVRLGLEALSGIGPTLVLIHDAARPFVESALIDRAIAAGLLHHAAVPGSPVTDTIKVVDGDQQVVNTPERASLRAVQTPQVFRFDSLLAAHRRAVVEGFRDFTDDGALAEWAGLAVRVFAGDAGNVKLTQNADFAAAERRLRNRQMPLVTRLGTGFDVHVFGEGDHVWLGGIRIPHERGLVAHSDGDVILHALTDAVLGALADGDIGTHFPPSDPQWKGASSDRFLAHAVELVRRKHGIVDHLDATLLCERPKLGPHRDAIRKRIAEIAGLSIDQVSVKATTTERLGFTGRGEGIAAQAAATIRLPEIVS